MSTSTKERDTEGYEVLGRQHCRTSESTRAGRRMGAERKCSSTFQLSSGRGCVFDSCSVCSLDNWPRDLRWAW